MLKRLFDIDICFYFYSIVMLMTYANPYFVEFNQNGIGYILILYVGVVLCYQYFINKEKINIKDNLCLYLYLLAYLVTTVACMKYNFIGNVKIFIWSFIQIVLFYNLFKNAYKTSNFEKLILFVELISLILSIASVLGYVLFSKGILLKRLFGYYFDPNFGSVISVISISISLYFLLKFKEKKSILHYVNLFFQTSYIILSQSRTGQLMILFLSVFFLIHSIMNSRKKGIVLSIGLCLLFLFGQAPVNNVYRVANQILYLDGAFISEKDELKDRGIKNQFDSTSERFTIWEDALELFKKQPLTGVSYAGLQTASKELRPSSYISKTDRDIHNGYIIVLTCGGLIGFIPIFIFMFKKFLLIITNFKVIFKDSQLLLLFSNVFLLLFSAVTLSEIFYQINFESAFFWVCLAILSAHLKEVNANEKCSN